MSLSFCVLGSGSGGNCTLVALHGRGRVRHLFIDAGLSPRETARRLGPLGLSPLQVGEALLTHVDSDHLHPGWIRLARRLMMRFRVHRRHVRLAVMLGLPVSRIEPFEGRFAPGPGTEIEPIALPHDQLGSTGFVIAHSGLRLGYATDLGRVTGGLLSRCEGLAALAIESNYDRGLELAARRPEFLKRRIMGGLGHLSNEQALDAVLAVSKRSLLRHVALLHLSQECNDPRLVRRLFARRAPHLLDRLTISRQHEPTPVLHVQPPAATLPAGPGRQLNFLEMLA